MRPPLHLKAHDADDLTVIAACLQDALVLVGDMVFLREERRFMLVANRFVWEAADASPDGVNERTSAALTIDRVTGIKRRNFDPGRADAILSLLTIRQSPGAIELIFADDAAIRLETDGIYCKLADLGEPWPTRWRPSHPLD
jgi:hypothetical protein